MINLRAGRRSRLAVALDSLLLYASNSIKSSYAPSKKITKLITNALAQEGLNVHVHVTHSADDATEITKDLVRRNERLILVAGGDGTVNEVINGMVGSDTHLGIIPLGSTNVLALELGIPFSTQAAAKVIREGHTRQIDLGKAGNHFFAMAAGISFDAQAIKLLSLAPGLKPLLGGLSFVLSGMLVSLAYPFPLLEIESEDLPGRHSGYIAIVSNARFYGGSFVMAPSASIDDGLLDVVIMKRRKLWNLMKYMSLAKKGNLFQLPDVEHFQTRRLKVSSNPPVFIHTDAELAGKTPCEFECIPRALRVIVPE